jgi:tripartite-type tricarboxylate transporter receptor subunit TctC
MFLVLSCCVILGLSSVAASGSTAPHKKQTTLQKGLAFYKGQTIVVVDSGSVGGSYDLYARVLMPYVAQYLHASYEIEDVSEADGIPGQNQAASAPPTGLTLGVFQLFASISKQVAGVQGLTFNVNRLAWVAGDGVSTNVLVASASSGITNIAQLIADSKTGTADNNPVKMLTSTAGSLASTLPRALLGLLGINVEYVTGYTNVAAEATGLVRGDGQLTFIASSTLGPLIAGGQAKAIAITGKIPLGTEYRSVEDVAPTFAQIFKKYPPKTKAGRKLAAALDDITTLPSGLMALQTGVPAYKVDAMRAAAAWAEKQPDVRSEMLADSLNPKVYNPVQAKSAFISSLKKETGLACYMTATCS